MFQAHLFLVFVFFLACSSSPPPEQPSALAKTEQPMSEHTEKQPEPLKQKEDPAAEEVPAPALKKPTDRKQECEDGDANACFEKGNDPAVALPDKLPFYDKGCQLKHGDSCLQVALHALANGDRKKAKATLELACNLGSPNSCTIMGQSYMLGDKALRLPKSPKKAKEYHKRAWKHINMRCERGDGNACSQIGQAYKAGHTGFNPSSGIKIDKDEEKGHGLLLHACEELKYADACRDLYRHHFSSEPDLAKSYKAKACAIEPDEDCQN
jgi:TPR repeat protein